MRIISRLLAVLAGLFVLAGASAAGAAQAPVFFWVLGGTDKVVDAIDLAGLKRDGDTVSVVALSLFRTTTSNGVDYSLTQLRLDCRAATSAILWRDSFRADGSLLGRQTGDGTPQAFKPDSSAGLIYDYVCKGQHTGAGLEGVTTPQAVVEARYVWPMDSEDYHSSSDYWMVGDLSSVAMVVDRNSVRRQGDEARVKVLIIGHEAPDQDYMVSEFVFNCATTTMRFDAVGVFHSDGSWSHPYMPADAGASAVPPGTQAAAAFAFVCHDARDGDVQIGAHAAGAVALNLRQQWPGGGAAYAAIPPPPAAPAPTGPYVPPLPDGPGDFWLVAHRPNAIALADFNTIWRSGDIARVVLVLPLRKRDANGADYLVVHVIINCAQNTWQARNTQGFQLDGTLVETSGVERVEDVGNKPSLGDRAYWVACQRRTEPGIHYNGATTAQEAARQALASTSDYYF